jgi:hypothetical protein
MLHSDRSKTTWKVNIAKAAMSATQRKKDEASMRKSMAKLCSELPDMQLEPDAPIMENVQKVIVHAKAKAFRMDTVETEYKARIKELEKQDPTTQLKEATKEVIGQMAYQIADTTHLLETTTESWMGIEQIEIVEDVHEEI